MLLNLNPRLYRTVQPVNAWMFVTDFFVFCYHINISISCTILGCFRCQSLILFNKISIQIGYKFDSLEVFEIQ